MVVVNEKDVLFGRGGATNNHMGNRKFRSLISKHQEEYLLVKKTDKKSIAISIVNEIHEQGGRFLKRVDDGSASDNAIDTQQWVEVTEKRACEKASQALREGLEVRVKDEDVGNPNKKRKTANNDYSTNLNNIKSDVQSPSAQTNMLLQRLSQLHNSLPPLGESVSHNIDDKGGNVSMNATPSIKCENDIVGV